MNKIRIWFSDFYVGFDPFNNLFLDLLPDDLNIEVDENHPDFLFYSCYGFDFLQYDCTRIFYTGENLRPDFNLCDYAIGFDHFSFEDRYIRFPNHALFKEQSEKLIQINDQDLPEKEFFCNFIYSNASANPIRDAFYHKLNSYKKVTSPGKHLNNSNIEIGGRYTDDWMFSKIGFQSKCKFTIAFENSSSPGYTTEKIMHAFLAKSIPIYWGDPKVDHDFNPKAFINLHEFDNNIEKAVEKVIELDKNEVLYEKMLRESAFSGNEIPSHLDRKVLTKFLYNILVQNPKEAIRKPLYGTTKNYEKRLKSLTKPKKKFKWPRIFS